MASPVSFSYAAMVSAITAIRGRVKMDSRVEKLTSCAVRSGLLLNFSANILVTPAVGAPERITAAT